MESTTTPTPAKLLLPDARTAPVLSIEAAGAALGLGRAAAYAAARAGRIPTIVVGTGNRRRVPTAALREMLGLPAESAA